MAVKRGGLGKGLDSMIPMSDSGAIRKKKTAQTSVQDAVKGEKTVDITSGKSSFQDVSEAYYALVEGEIKLWMKD